MLLTIYNSKRNTYGNCYYACRLTHLDANLAQGTLTADNINTIRLRELGVEVTHQELPIRDFKLLTKGWQDLGCKWEMISERLRLEKHVNDVLNTQRDTLQDNLDVRKTGKVFCGDFNGATNKRTAIRHYYGRRDEAAKP